jgi:hypothetical protein
VFVRVDFNIGFSSGMQLIERILVLGRYSHMYVSSLVK